MIFRNCVIKGVRCGVEGWRRQRVEEQRVGGEALWVLLMETKLLGKQSSESSRRRADTKITGDGVSEDAGYTWFYQITRGPEIQLDQAWVKCQVKAKPNTRINAKLGMVSELMFVKCHRSSTFFRHLMILWHKEKAKQRATFISAPLKTQGTKSVPDVRERTRNCLQPQ